MAEVKTLSAADRWPSLVQTAVRLAKDLDERRFATSHASLARQLRQVMADLHAASVGRKGKLATVAALAHRPRPGVVFHWP